MASTTFTRDEAKKEIPGLLTLILGKHRPADHTEKNLKANKHIKGFYEIAQHFIMIDHMCIKYQTESTLRSEHLVGVKITEVTVYDNWYEYEQERITQLTKNKSTYNQN